MLMVLIGYIHGRTSGGDSTTALWEIRNQIYMFVAYILTCNTIRTRRQVNTMIWILVIGTGIKGMQGVWRWRITYGGHLGGIEAIMPHEQSFFFNAFLTLTAILYLYGGSRRMKRVALFLLPFVLAANLANQRRAAILALAFAAVALLVITAITYRPKRKTVGTLLLALVVIGPAYYIAFQHSGGVLGQVARALNSATSPGARDAGSNQYRVNEDKDIMATMKSSLTSAIIGYGYGKPMFVPYALPDIHQIYIFWNIMPHDSILWVWMRLGTIGYILLWVMIGTAIIQIAQVMLRLKDPYLKGLALWILLMIVQEIVFGYLDLQWTIYRNTLMIGMLFALISRLATFADHENADDATDHGEDTSARRWTRRPDISRSLAVVNGRLAHTAPQIGLNPLRRQ
jgi:uncharacterized membrane protein (UPF0136 family)